MTNFLFWNLNKKPIAHLVSALTIEYDIDILILAECSIHDAELLVALNRNRERKYALSFSPSKRVLVLTRFPRDSIQPLRDEGGISIRRIQPPVGIEILLVAVHLSSKLYQDSTDQALTATRLPSMIEEEENGAGHKRTVVVGDLNMDPFEAGVSGADALHGIMDKSTALKVSRMVNGRERFFFYNPMWSRMGDGSPGPPGTYYRSSSRQVNYFWNTFDQVLLRPDLLDRFDDSRLRVPTKAGETSLTKVLGAPNSESASDHFPIVFTLDLLSKET